MATDAVIGVRFINIVAFWQVSGQEYELWLSPDSSTDGHTQWYFFSIANGRAKVPYRLHIHNFRKAHSLYSQGLQPLLHSSKEASLTVSCLHAFRLMEIHTCAAAAKWSVNVASS